MVTSDDKALVAELTRNLAAKRRSEADDMATLIAPVVAHLGYETATVTREYPIARKRADMALWGEGASPAHAPTVILEAKRQGTDFGSGPGSPLRQIEGYMVAEESSPDVWGVLTDGVRWRVLRRKGSTVDCVGVVELELPGDPDAVAELRDLIGYRVSAARMTRSPVTAPRRLLEALAGTAEDALEALGVEGAGRIPTADNAERKAFKEDYVVTAWGEGPVYAQEQQSLGEPRVAVGVVHVRAPLNREAVQNAMRALARQSPARAAVAAFARREGDDLKACFATHLDGRTSVGERFDPDCPNAYAAANAAAVEKALAKPELNWKAINDLASNHRLHATFFADVRRWIAKRMAGRGLAERKALLRHLLRCVFAWAMKERAGVPNALFDPWWWGRAGGVSYHHDVVRFLFHKRLNRPPTSRQRHRVPAIHEAMREVRFLNGSLFAEQEGDDFELSDNDYFGHGESGDAGLWTIFERAGWTTQEEDATAREQAIDPKMLGLLFEQLIAAVDQGDSDKLMERMPDGTYYTPVDVVWEMAKEATAARLLQEPLPDGWATADVRRLFDDDPGHLPRKGRKALADRLAALTFFDPCVGSGEFALGCIRVVRRGLLALNPGDERTRVRSIVERQVFAQDVNPLAVAVARLRAFMAIEHDEADDDGEHPLPNLEAKIVCADTLGTEIRSAGAAQMGDLDPVVERLLAECQAEHDKYMAAHQPGVKRAVAAKRRRLGDALAGALRRTGGTGGSLEAFALHDYLNHENDKPAAADPRWTFGQAQHGFDVVIGNPPYVQATPARMGGKEKVAALKARTKRNGYHAFDDLYVPFCQAALELTRPDVGVVSLVVPLSISFAEAKAHIREAFVRQCRAIALRHQDNRPDKTFGESPVEHAENRQRTTIVTASRGGGDCEVLTSGLGRWFSADRSRYFQRRRYVGWNAASARGKLGSGLAGQWPKLCIQEAAEVVAAVAKRGASPQWSGAAAIGMPKSAMYFVTAAPAGMLARGEETIACDRSGVASALAVLNAGIAYLWWKAWGDGFHVKASTFAAMPDIRHLADRKELDALGWTLLEVLQRGGQMIQSGTSGGRQTESVNLWESAPETLHAIDELLLRGLGFEDTAPYHAALTLERSNDSTRRPDGLALKP